jgi:Mg-chelatase subunit ChlD
MVIRNFRSFTHSELARLDVVVLVDSSESVLPSFQREITDVQQLISQWPWNSEDQLSVLSFSGMETHFVCAGDCRSSFSADRLSRGGPTPLFDALETATKYLAQRRQQNVLPVIVLFSDGEDTISRASFREVLAKILATEAQVYAVDVGTSAQASNGTATLQKIADDSGGRRVPISEGVAGIFNDVINDLHSARVVTYLRPESVSDFHSIRILPTRNLNLQFRCRRGYYSQAGSSHSEDGP